MAIIHINIFLLIFLFVIYSNNATSTESVPVILWNIESHKHVPALQHIGKKSFKDIVQSYTKDDPFVIVFEDENLSTEDFTSKDTSGTNVFDSLYKLIEDDAKSKLAFFPSVQSPVHVLSNLAKTKIDTITANELRTGERNIPSPAPGHYIFISLDEANDDEDRPHLLKRHVKFMIDIFKKVQSQYPNTLAIYTAERPSWYVPNMGLSRKTRNLLQVDVAAPTNQVQHFDNEYIRMYMRVYPYLVKEDKSTYFTDLQFSAKLNETSETIEVTAKGKNGTIVMYYTKSAGYWYLSTIEVDDNEFSSHDIYAPFGFSYHCSELKMTGKTATVVFPKIQFQPNFNPKVQLEKFGDAYDCVGFTTVPIWSGLFVTLILAVIMTFGLTMMMDIKTMDRFDDPKGKGVTINVVE